MVGELCFPLVNSIQSFLVAEEGRDTQLTKAQRGKAIGITL